jgi:hypothetical protein
MNRRRIHRSKADTVSEVSSLLLTSSPASLVRSSKEEDFGRGNAALDPASEPSRSTRCCGSSSEYCALESFEEMEQQKTGTSSAAVR